MAPRRHAAVRPRRAGPRVTQQGIRYNARMPVSRRSLIVGGAAAVVGIAVKTGVAAARPTITVYKDPT